MNHSIPGLILPQRDLSWSLFPISLSPRYLSDVDSQIKAQKYSKNNKFYKSLLRVIDV